MKSFTITENYKPKHCQNTLRPLITLALKAADDKIKKVKYLYGKRWIQELVE